MARLVLADANPTIQTVVRLCFSEKDDQVSVFADGVSALAHLEEEVADVVLADVSLTGLNGYELCRRIKRNPEMAHIPVVLLVGARAEADPILASQVGCDRQVSKPVDTLELVGLVKGLIQESRTPSSVDPVAPSPAAKRSDSPLRNIPLVDLSSEECHSRPPLYQRPGPDPTGEEAAAPEPSPILGLGPDLLLDRLVDRLRQELPRILEDVAGDLRQEGED